MQTCPDVLCVYRLKQQYKMLQLRKNLSSDAIIIYQQKPWKAKCVTQCDFVLTGDIRKMAHSKCIVCGCCQHCVFVASSSDCASCIFCGMSG